jgi:hypothetical protein
MRFSAIGRERHMKCAATGALWNYLAVLGIIDNGVHLAANVNPHTLYENAVKTFHHSTKMPQFPCLEPEAFQFGKANRC